MQDMKPRPFARVTAYEFSEEETRIALAAGDQGQYITVFLTQRGDPPDDPS